MPDETTAATLQWPAVCGWGYNCLGLDLEVLVRVFAMTVIWAGASLGLGVASVHSQSLGELAAKEKERRKGDTTRVVTEEDLAKRSRAGRTNTSATPSESPSTATPAASPGGKTDDEKRAEARKAWEQRRQQTEAEIEQLTKQIADLQQSLGDTSVSQFGPGRARAAEQLQQAQDKLTAARQRLEDFDEERRRQGF
jgi:hypothetical protein